MDYSLQSKIAIVTGASSDIGLAIVNKLLGNGAVVFAHFNHSQIPIENKNLFKIKVDFNSKDEWKLLVDNAKLINGRIDFLINCASMIENKDFLEINFEDMLYVYNINLFSHILLMQKVFSEMCENKFGRIISLSSIGVKYAGSKQSMLYSSSKAALEAITKSFAKFGASCGVLANTIRVGVVETKIHKKKNMEERKKLIPLQTFGKPEDISEMAIYLCSKKSEFITGQEFSVSGGE